MHVQSLVDKYPQLEVLDGEYVCIYNGGTATLDGSFTANQLRLIADVIDKEHRLGDLKQVKGNNNGWKN